jgi:hypothetical protein
MELPFINGDDTRMIPNTFEAYRVDIKPSDLFRFGFAYVTREKSKTSAEFRSMSEVAGLPGVDRGTSVAGFLLGATDTTYVGAVNELTWDLLNIVYVEAGKTWQLPDDFQIRGELQFIDQQSVGEELLGSFGTQLYGESLTASYRSAVLRMSFTSTTASGLKILRQFGGVPAFNSLMISDFAGAGEDSFRIGVSYDFARFGLAGVKAFANYAHGKLSSNQGRTRSTLLLTTVLIAARLRISGCAYVTRITLQVIKSPLKIFASFSTTHSFSDHQRTRRRSLARPAAMALSQRAPAIISFMIFRPLACNGPMPLPGRNHMPLSLSRQYTILTPSLVTA